MALPEGLGRITTTLWAIGLALILAGGALQCRPYLDEARNFEQKASMVADPRLPLRRQKELRAYLERTRGASAELEAGTWRVELAQVWRDEARQWRSRAQKAWTTAWLVVGGSWTGGIWGLYLLTAWIRRAFGRRTG